MRFFDGQVHVLELAGLIVASFFSFAFGYSLPVFALVMIVFWPLFLLQLLLQGIFEGAFRGLGWIYRKIRPLKPKPKLQAAPTPPRTGVARYLWFLPLVTMTLGYGKYVIETGRWFI